MLTVNAYVAELKCWKHLDQDYIALTHPNMNVDNAYFWRDGAGKLHCGVFDWGSMGSMCVGHKLWWWLYCADYSVFNKFLAQFIQAFVGTYSEYGGPALR